MSATGRPVSFPVFPEVEARNARLLRRLNLVRVLGFAVDRPGPFTRSEVIEATGLSAPTVGYLGAELVRRGLLKQVGAGPSRGGRRPTFLEFNARHGFVAGVDLGPTKTRLAVADLRGERLAYRVMPTPARLGPAALLGHLAAAVRRLMQEAGVPRERLLAVGAGAPGAVDPGTGIVELAPNLKGWKQVPMGHLLGRALGAPVAVENDVNLAVLGERWKGAARGHDTCVFVYVGTGIGAGVVLGGELYRGHHFLAGEVGFMSMGPQYVERDFGTRGCLETLAGLRGLVSRWRRSARGHPDRWVAQLFDAAQGSDRGARRVLARAGTLIGIATANLSLVLDPSLVVLGGALALQGDLVVAEVRRIVARVVPVPVEIVPSTLGTEAPLWGSVLAGMERARALLRATLGEAQTSS